MKTVLFPPNRKLYLVMKVCHTVTIEESSLFGRSEKHEFKMLHMPVFESLQEAQAHSQNKYEIIIIEISLTTTHI